MKILMSLTLPRTEIALGFQEDILSENLERKSNSMVVKSTPNFVIRMPKCLTGLLEGFVIQGSLNLSLES